MRKFSDDDSDDDFEEAAIELAPAPALIEKPDLDDLEEFDLEAATKESLLKTNVQRKHHDDDDENLGDNFEETPWVPPSVVKAQDYKQHAMFRSGAVPLRQVNLCRAADLGNGTVMYFQFLRSMGVCLFVLTLLSVPSLFFAFWGSRMPFEDRDSFYFYRFAFGNIGFNKESSKYETESQCYQNKPYYNVNETCIALPGNQEISLSVVGSVLTLLEVLQAFAFFCTIWHLKRRLFFVETELSKDVTTVTDYSIRIKNLPKDTTELELLTHFSNLYPLDRPDWKNRPYLADAKPVDEVDNTKDSRYKGTWVAECFIMRKYGKTLAAFLKQEQLRTKLRRARATAKLYANSTTHARGPNPKKHAAAMKKVQRLEMKADEIAHTIIKLKAISAKSGKDVDSEKFSAQEKAEQLLDSFEPTSGFIIFQYSESMARCIEDWDKYSSFPYSLCYPEAMKFKGRRLHVTRAPEPEQLVFENMEVPLWKKFCYRLATNAIAFILLAICFAIVVQGSIYKTKFSAEIPNLNDCSEVVPFGYAYANASTMAVVDDYALYRPPVGIRAILDDECEAAVPGTFYAVMAQSADTYDNTLVDYSISSCTQTSSGNDGLCPFPNGEPQGYCPCVSLDSDQQCPTYQCYDDESSTACEYYPASVVGSCYCFQFLLDMISQEGADATINYIKSSKTDACYPFFVNYSKATAITYGTTIVTVLINFLLKKCLAWLVECEYHSDLDKLEASLMLKVFITTFFNMAAVVLLAFGLVASEPALIKQASILTGPYPDFTSAWYGVVGAYLVLTFFIQVITIPASDLFSFFISRPLWRCCLYPHIMSQSSYSVAMQEDLNAMEVAPQMDKVTKTAQVLALLFFCMLYASGLPLLVPITCIAFIIYFCIQKRLILRHHKRPLRDGVGIIQCVIGLLPYAVLLRLMFSTWMLSNNDVLPPTFPILSASGAGSSPVAVNAGSNNYLSFLSSLQTTLVASHPGLTSVVLRLTQPNIFPLVALIALIIAIKLILKIWPLLPLSWVGVFGVWVMKTMGRRNAKVYVDEAGRAVNSVEGYDLLKKEDGLREEMAPFTGVHFSYLGRKDEPLRGCCARVTGVGGDLLSEQERLEGYISLDQGQYIVKSKQWMQTTMQGGVSRIKGDLKRTWELIREVGIYSYHLKNHPRYKSAWHILVDGASTVNEYAQSKQTNTKQKHERMWAANAENDWHVKPKTSKASTDIESAREVTKVKKISQKNNKKGRDSDDDDDDDDDDSDDDDSSEEDSDDDDSDEDDSDDEEE